MENLRAFKVTTLPATNSKPTRVKLQDLRFDKTIILNYSAKSSSNEKDLIVDYLKQLGIDIIAQSWSENTEGQHQYSIYLTDNFDIQLN